MSPAESREADEQRALARVRDEVRAPRDFGRFRLLRRLGHGGTGTVFVALEPLQVGARMVVLKRLHEHLSEIGAARETFLDEARLAVSLSHPCIVRAFDFGNVEGRPFMTMEYLSGIDLGRVFARLFERGERLPPRVAGRVICEVLRALEYAHERIDPRGHPAPIVHRDVSPQNVFLTFDGQVKLLDFGIAKGAARSVHTSTGVVKGKLGYMAPEQAAGDSVDSRADLWAAGVVLWEALAGRYLFDGSGDFATLTGSLVARLPSLSEVRDNIPQTLIEVSDRALERSAWCRYQRAREMRDAIVEGLAGDVADDNALSAYVTELFADELDEERELSLGWQTQLTRASLAPRSVPHFYKLLALGLLGVLCAAVAVLFVYRGELTEHWSATQSATKTAPAPAHAAMRVSTGAERAERTADANQASNAESTDAKPKRPRARASSPGFLTLVTVPWSDVYLDGKRVGSTPLVRLELPSGPHMLTLKNPQRGISSERTVNIEAGKIHTEVHVAVMGLPPSVMAWAAWALGVCFSLALIALWRARLREIAAVAQASRSLQKLKRAQALLNSIPDLLITVDEGERVTEIKVATRPGKASPLPRFEHKTLANLFSEQALSTLRAACARCLSTADVQTCELEVRLFGDVRSYEVRVAMAEPPSVIVLLRDVTERRVTERALSSALETAEAIASARTDFLAQVGHDLRNSVTGVVGITDLLLTRAAGADEATRHYLTVIQRSGEHLVALVNDVIDFTRLEQRKLSLRVEPVNARALVEDTIALFEPEAARNESSLHAVFDDAVPGRLQLDPHRTRQLLTNLVANAVKFTSRGEIAIKVAMRDSELTIEVSDTGVGIAPAALPFVFDAFVQVDEDETRRLKGSGLGLAITKQLVDLLGGRIEVKSALGKGTTFSVQLPELPELKAG